MIKYLMFIVLTVGSLNSYAKSSLEPNSNKRKITLEEARKKCSILEGQKRIKFERICSKVEEITKEEELKNKYPFLSVRLGSEYLFTDYELKDKRTGDGATLSSNSHLKFDTQFLQHYSPSFKSYFGLSYQSIVFDNSLSKPLKSANLSLWNFSSGLIYLPIKRLSLDLGLHYGDVFYAHTLGANNLDYTKQLVPTGMFQLGYDFFSLGGVTLGAKAKIAYTAPFTSKNRDRIEGNFKAKGSFQHGAELYARKKFNKWSLQGGLSYMDKPLDTNEYKSNLRSIGVGFKVAIPFGWNEE